jgi:hypothetical protein
VKNRAYLILTPEVGNKDHAKKKGVASDGATP